MWTLAVSTVLANQVRTQTIRASRSVTRPTTIAAMLGAEYSLVIDRNASSARYKMSTTFSTANAPQKQNCEHCCGLGHFALIVRVGHGVPACGE
jgi:hypothetical protein